ncbi:amidohydrolase [Ktedonosporobacter rubrisoli]|uniref:Amidohydrolase n=1 Tax=Ktedonosporobacter rubrisoli TaxID=2509675 RepID=A0A4P6JTL6_KTERU|nr:amidohydrolase family protein [Ktedonosporobacter rubrisoli]QBD78246.1 amidohydrolase [Ktedonosporobacter rubrisoli]
MPNFPLIDAHLHLWNPTHFRMPWLDNNPLLNRSYELREYYEHTADVAIEAMVYLQVDVEPAYALLEAQWVLERANQDQRIQAIVPWAPIEYGERARAFLEALTALDPCIKGVRRNIQDEADPNFCLLPDFIRGLQLLPEYGLSFDICVKHWQLASAVKMVQLCPDTAFILDHIGKPDIKGQLFAPWLEHIQALASYPNVLCKISGLVSEANHEHWTAEDLAPYVAHVIEAFGEDRIVFGGDWPVALLATTYTRWVATLDSLTAHFSPEAKRKLWAENARSFYRL